MKKYIIPLAIFTLKKIVQIIRISFLFCEFIHRIFWVREHKDCVIAIIWVMCCWTHIKYSCNILTEVHLFCRIKIISGGDTKCFDMFWKKSIKIAIFLGFNISSDINVSYSVLLIRHHIMRWLDYFYKLHTNGGGLLIANNITRFTYTLQYFFSPALFCVFLCYQTCYSKYPRIPSSKTKKYIYIYNPNKM